jgi:hypothetical protein
MFKVVWLVRVPSDVSYEIDRICARRRMTLDEVAEFMLRSFVEIIRQGTFTVAR